MTISMAIGGIVVSAITGISLFIFGTLTAFAIETFRGNLSRRNMEELYARLTSHNPNLIEATWPNFSTSQTKKEICKMTNKLLKLSGAEAARRNAGNEFSHANIERAISEIEEQNDSWDLMQVYRAIATELAV
jgi:hypothetical protein